jgi:hypothetical protein
MALSLKTGLRALFGRKPSFRVGNNSSPASVQSYGEKLVFLNSDSEAVSSDGATWLLKCIFQDQELFDYAVAELDRRLPGCKTYKEIKRVVFEHFLGKVSASGGLEALQPLDARAFQAVLAHQGDTRRNERAYQIRILDRPESGFWPSPTDPRNGRSLFTEFPFRKSAKFITKETAIVSAGSCFAMEIAHELQRGGFNYLITEWNGEGRLAKVDGGPVLSDSSAAWGIIFNNPSFRQLVERAFGLREVPRILWSSHAWDGDKGYYMDPFREEIKFGSPEEYLANCAAHISATREALKKAEVFIITLGLNEVWRFKMDGSVFSRSPWRIAPSFVEHLTLTVEENVAELQIMLDVLRQFNPGVKVIVSLSPVPLHATFLHEKYHVVEANMHSKAVLRVAAQEFIERNDEVYYLPSFELITCGIKEPWQEDQRHVNPNAVGRVMEMFREMFVS